jgi:Mce-associated membrane protein
MTDEGAVSPKAAGETVAELIAEDELADGAVVVDAAPVADEIAVADGIEAAEDSAVAVAVMGAATPKPQRAWLTPALIGGLVAALGAAGFFGWQFVQDHQVKAAAEDAQRAAVTYAQVLTSVDSNKVDENFKAVLDGATGEFKDMYSQSSVELRQLLIENKATAHGVVVESAVQSASKDKAVVLLFVDQSVSNTKLPDPRIDRSRMKMTLEKVDGTWRASKVELP